MPQGQQSAITAGLGSTQAPRAKTRRQLLADMDIGGRYNLIVGPASTMADALPASAGQTGVHGFNLARTITPCCLEAVVDRLVPELQHRGACKTAYAPGTLRDKLFGAGPRLPARHPEAAARWSQAPG